MDKDDADLSEAPHKRGEALSARSRQLGEGRLGTYTMLGAACGIVPLPWIPDATVRRVRGALVHDLTSRHGLSLTHEARAILVEPNGTEGPRGFLSQGAKFAVGRVLGRLGPFAMIAPVRSALGTYVLGHLLQRYLETARTARSVRIDIEEARRVRRAIDQALIYALTTEAHPSREDRPFAPEDLREGNEQLIDGVLISIASMPGWLVRRLDAAFDDVLSSVRA
jgi:uncharacterized protein (DUF697 family)